MSAATTVSDATPPPPTTVSQTTLPSSTLQFNFEENDEIAYSYVPCPTPAATSFINTLKKDKLPVNRRFLKQLVTAPSCAICSDEFKLKESVNKLPCRHWFHHDCIGRWLSLKNNCPLCRHEFPREPDHHIRRSPVPERPIQTAAAAGSVVQLLVARRTARIRSQVPERPIQTAAAAAAGRPVQLLVARRTARIRAMLPNRRLAEY